MDRFRAFTTAGVIIAALTGYVFWGPNTKSKSRTAHIPGLLNLGNTCFLNAVLQALAACPAFVRWLALVVARNDGPLSAASYDNEPSLKLCKALLETLEVLNNYRSRDDVSEYEPHKILSALREHHWIITADEQDAHEMFLVLSSTLDEELGVSKDKRRCSLADVHLPDIADWQSLELNTITPTVLPLSPFKGLLTSRLMCKNCENKYPLKYDTFDSLSISIPPMTRGAVTLQTCLKYFVTSELVPNVDCENCAQNLQKDTRTTFLKQLSIGKLPVCLCIHIQRTVWQRNGMPMKRYEHIIYPEYLNMDEFLCNNQNFNNYSSLFKNLVGGSCAVTNSLDSETSLQATDVSNILMSSSILPGSSEIQKLRKERNLYRLQSVIVHLGDVFTGHFVTYRRGALKSKNCNNWYLTSDTTVRSTSLEEVLKYPAYVLFYERVVPLQSAVTDRRLSVFRRVQL